MPRQDRTRFRNVFGVFLVAAVTSMIFADSADAQRGGRGGRGGMAMRMMGGNSQFGLLNDKRVQEELELVDDQVKELEEIQDEANQIMRDMFSELQDLPREEMRDAFRNIREKMKEKMQPFEGRVNDVLLPHQQDRLKQLGFQNTGRDQGASSALENDSILDELEVTDEQREELEEAIKKAREELKKKYADLVKDAEDTVLKVLDSDQRKKYRELVGDPFKFETRNNRQRNRSTEQGDRGRRGDR